MPAGVPPPFAALTSVHVSDHHPDLHKLAALARLRVDDEDAARLRPRLERLVRYFEALAAVDTTGVEPEPYPLALPPRVRDDEPGPVLPVDEVLANAPRRRADCFLVPRAVDG